MSITREENKFSSAFIAETDGSSRSRTTTTAADGLNDIEKNKQKEFQQEESGESGYISGPITSSSSQLIDDYDKQEDNDRNLSSKHHNIQPNIRPDNISGKNFQHFDIEIDSGCIAEDDEDDANVIQTISTDEKMIIEPNLTESMCNLSLNQNNLNTTHSTILKNATSAATTSAQKKSNADQKKSVDLWEICYQQNNDGDTQLHIATIIAKVDIVAKLIKISPHPCLFNIQNDEAQSALHIAAITGQPQIIRMLLIAGADATIRDRNGNTALHLACVNGDLQCVQALTLSITSKELEDAQRSYLPSYQNFAQKDRKSNIPNCAQLPTDLEIRNYDGERCVHLAAQGNFIEILRHLFWFNADINAREGKSGRTPLHIAIEQHNDQLIEFLMEDCKEKINVETETYGGLTAYQFACILQNQKVQLHLQRKGALALTPPDSDIEDSDDDYGNDYQKVSVHAK